MELELTRGWPKGDMALRWGVAGALLAAGAPALAAGLPAWLLTLTLQEWKLTICSVPLTSTIQQLPRAQSSHCLAQGEKLYWMAECRTDSFISQAEH